MIWQLWIKSWARDRRQRHFAALLPGSLRLAESVAQLFANIAIPRMVFVELTAAGAPDKVRKWAENLPAWVTLHDRVFLHDETLALIDPGEREAILLAEQLQATLLLMDDQDGRNAARNRGLAVSGLIGILGKAAKSGLLDFDVTVARLRATNFRVSETVVRLVKENLSKSGRP